MHLEDDFLNAKGDSDPASIFEKNLSRLEDKDPNIISIIEKINGIPRRLYFQKGSRFIKKGKRGKETTEEYLIFLGSSLGYKSSYWEKYNIRLDPGQKLHLAEYMKIKNLFENFKKPKES